MLTFILHIGGRSMPSYNLQIVVVTAAVVIIDVVVIASAHGI